MSAYYNEIDPKAAATLRELISEGLIAPGDVDERSIEDVLPSDIAGYTQVHLFAGFGIWSLAFRMAGWPDSRPVWSASFPCQPFSAAGKGGGFADERHLWPSGFWLLQHGKQPNVPIYGEQVASPDGLTWLDLVRADLETIKHSVWSVVLASAGFGAPIIRQRTYWLGFPNDSRREGYGLPEIQRGRDRAGENMCSTGPSSVERLASAKHNGSCGPEGFAAFADSDGTNGRISDGSYWVSDDGRPSATNGFWRDADWLRCRDDKWRPVESGTFPLANGDSERVGCLRGYGNAISPQVAAAWIKTSEGLLR